MTDDAFAGGPEPTPPAGPAPPAPPASFGDALRARRLVFDGPMGTPLLARGHALPVELLNGSAPQAVRDLHAAYVAAGARVLRANTLLAREGEVRDPERLAKLGVALAREAAPPGVWVGAPIGAPAPKPQPSSRPGRGRPGAPVRVRQHAGDEQPTVEPEGNGFPRGVREALADQARAVAGADFISLETFLLPLELEMAFEAVRESWSGPVVAFCTLRSDLPTRLDAMSTQRVYGALLAFLDVASRFSPAAVGVNCVPPGALLDLAIDFLSHESPSPWGVLPAAAPGGPRRAIRGPIPGRVSDTEMAEACVRALDGGAAFAGACCGATPETVRRIAAFASAPPGTLRTRYRERPPAGRRVSPQRAGVPGEGGYGERAGAGGRPGRQGGLGRQGGAQDGRQAGRQGGRQGGYGGQRGGGRPFGTPYGGQAGERGGRPGQGPRPSRGQGRPGRLRFPAPFGENRGTEGSGPGRGAGRDRGGTQSARGGRPPHRGRGGRPPYGAQDHGGQGDRAPRGPGGARRPGPGGPRDPEGATGGPPDNRGGRRHGRGDGRSGEYGATGGASWSGRPRPPFGRGGQPRDDTPRGGGQPRDDRPRGGGQPRDDKPRDGRHGRPGGRPGGQPGRGRGRPGGYRGGGPEDAGGTGGAGSGEPPRQGRTGGHAGGRPGPPRGRGGRPPRGPLPDRRPPDEPQGEETGGAFGAP